MKKQIWRIYTIFIYSVILFPTAFVSNVRAKEFETFDGRIYNNRYYPRIDLIDWQEDRTVQFHVYWKGHPIDLGFKVEKQGGKKLLRIHYFIKERNEHLCRHIEAPYYFPDKIEGKFLYYKDISDVDMDRYVLTLEEQNNKHYVKQQPINYVDCAEEKEEEEEDSTETTQTATPPKGEKKSENKMGNTENYVPSKGAILKKGSSTPFSDW